MRSTRGSSGSDLSRADRADAASRRLALLAADLGATEAGPRPNLSLSVGDFTRVVPSRRAVPPDPGPVEPPEPPLPPVVPRPGRHAARRRRGLASLRMPRLPGLGPAQLAVLAVIVAAGVALTAWWVVRDQAAPVPVPVQPASSASLLVATPSSAGPSRATSAGASGTVTVDVTGKVRRPGIVVLDTGARVVDALEAAGGERSGVDLSSINLARVLVDGEQIVVGAAQPNVPVAPSGSSVPGAPTALVNLNTAAQAELETLPDVGPVTALAIVAWRDEHGGFTSVDELLEVDGIGETTLSNLAPYVTV
jgi:competence protein ComEA